LTIDPAEQQAMAEPAARQAKAVAPGRRRISLELPADLVAKVDSLKSEWGVRSRGDALQRLLQQIFAEDIETDDSNGPGLLESTGRQAPEPSQFPGPPPEDQQPLFQEASALVLLDPKDTADLAFALAYDEPPSSPASRRSTGASIDLPGFVRKNADRLRSSLHPERHPAQAPATTMALFSDEQMEAALEASHRHWLDLYGKPANAAVLEASMHWLARDVWPESDSSEGRPFTWSLAQQVVRTFAPGWTLAEASFERVIVMSGILEDPFSGNTLALRIPTLIRRFVQRVRQRRGGMSFNTLQETMTLHGALKLLNLPTTAGQRFTKDQIRDAFRQQALNHHPDSGGSADMMRRLNEAYQLLKDQYGARS
jgi:hypothetical protein